MEIRIVINCDNAAFEDAGTENELARILEDTAKKLRSGGMGDLTLKDINGNTVGSLDIWGE